MISRKVNCIVCNKEIGFNRQKIKDGWLCPECDKILTKEFGVKVVWMKKEDLIKFYNYYTSVNGGVNLQEFNADINQTPSSINKIEIAGEITGVLNTKKCKVVYANGQLSIIIPKLLNLGEEIYNAKITSVIVFAEKKSGILHKGKVGFRLLEGESSNDFIIKYDEKHQWRVEAIIKEINSYLKEIKVTCLQCGNEHYFNEEDIKQANNAALLNFSKGMMAIGGSIPLAFLPDKEVTDFRKCKSCGSRNVELAEVIHKKSN